MKKSIETITDNSNKISHALIGNEFTGGMGLIHKVKQVDDETQKNREDINLLKDNMNLVKWFGSGIFGLIMAMILYILQSKI